MNKNDLNLLSEAYSSMYKEESNSDDLLSLILQLKDADWRSEDPYIEIANYYKENDWQFDDDDMEQMQTLKQAKRENDIENIYGPENEFLMEVDVDYIVEVLKGDLESIERGYQEYDYQD